MQVIFYPFYAIILAMVITYLGKQFFKITQGDMVLAFNPVSKNSKSGVSAHFGADIAISSTNHPDYNGLEQLTHGERVPFAITGPGDYEIKEIFIRGEMSDALIGSKKYVNTIYSLSVDNIGIAFLGALSHDEISKEAHEIVDSADILFVPVGGGSLLDAKASAKLVSSLEPRVVIPMDYDAAALKTFLKELGEEDAQVLEKLPLKRKDLENKEGEVIVLRPV